MVEVNESKAYQLPLIEGYHRGNLYRLIQLKFGKKEEFLNYFEDYLNISRQTIYFYLYFADSIDNYPALLATGFTTTILVKERKKIKEQASVDVELLTLLSKPYPGFKAKNLDIKDPTLELPEDISSQIKTRLTIKETQEDINSENEDFFDSQSEFDK